METLIALRTLTVTSIFFLTHMFFLCIFHIIIICVYEMLQRSATVGPTQGAALQKSIQAACKKNSFRLSLYVFIFFLSCPSVCNVYIVEKNLYSQICFFLSGLDYR